MISAFFACPPDAWEQAFDMARATGRPLSEEIVIADLRWLSDRVRMGRLEAMPAIRALSDRWGKREWHWRRVTRLVADVDRWCDPEHVKARSCGVDAAEIADELARLAGQLRGAP